MSLWLATLACLIAASYGAYATVRQALAPPKKSHTQSTPRPPRGIAPNAILSEAKNPSGH